MKRLWMLVGVAVVAAAMYVAAAPGSRQATGPTARQFNVLKKQVASLSKNLKALKKDEATVKLAAGAAVDYIGACFLDTNANIVTLAVSQFGTTGTTTTGFLYGTAGSATPPTARTGLDVDTSATPLAHLQEVNATCLQPAAAALPHSIKLLTRAR